MPNKHFCQGPHCHTRITTDRFLKSRGVIRGRYAMCDKDKESYCERSKYFCSTNCESLWLDEHMQHIEQGRSIEFIRHRRESGGTQNLWYEKKTETSDDYFGRPYTRTEIRKIERVDNSDQ